MIHRTIIPHLKQWKDRQDRKPLILRGARQVGKTTAVEMVSSEFENYIYLNLELGMDREIFANDLSVRETFQAMQVIKNIELKEGDTLIFIDEIQHAPKAIALLRYFFEEMNELHVIGAGSLLETLLERESISFPVGRVEYMYLYPLSFQEFLDAKGEKQLLDMYNGVPCKKFAHSKLLNLFHEYALIGGMPEIVQKHAADADISSLNRVYESLLISYLNDAEKYAKNHTFRQVLRHCLESIPFEAGNRIKLEGFGRSNYRSREVGEALRLIEKAMVCYLIYPSTSTEIPLRTQRKKSPKLQFIDTGLLNYFAGLQPEYYRYDDLHGFHQGVIAEHVVRQELMALDLFRNNKIPFWVREKKQSSAEVDLLLQYKNMVIPIEVKSGKTGTLRSLHQFMDRTDHPYAVRCSSGNLSITDGVTTGGKPYNLLNLPYYLAGKIVDYLDWWISRDGEIG